MLKQFLLRVFAILFGVVASFLAAELILRVSPLPTEELATGALKTRHSSRPGQPDFRDRGYHLRGNKPEGTFRLLVVGDSFTWGAGVLAEDAYPDRMAVRLSKRQTSQRVEVINFSRPGWNSVRELRSLQSWIGDLDPDALVVGYCLNDAEPSDRAALEQLREGSRSRSPARALSRALYRYSRIYQRLFDKIENIRRRRALAVYYHRLYAEPGWEEARGALGGFKRLADQRHIPMLLVLFPIFDSQLDWRYKYDDLHGLLRRTAAELGIESLDLLAAAFRGVDARRLALVPFTDGHPSEIAHRLAAKAILDRLTQRAVFRTEPSAVDREAGSLRRRDNTSLPRKVWPHRASPRAAILSPPASATRSLPAPM